MSFVKRWVIDSQLPWRQALSGIRHLVPLVFVCCPPHSLCAVKLSSTRTNTNTQIHARHDLQMAFHGSAIGLWITVLKFKIFLSHLVTAHLKQTPQSICKQYEMLCFTAMQLADIWFFHSNMILNVVLFCLLILQLSLGPFSYFLLYYFIWLNLIHLLPEWVYILVLVCIY